MHRMTMRFTEMKAARELVTQRIDEVQEEIDYLNDEINQEVIETAEQKDIEIGLLKDQISDMESDLEDLIMRRHLVDKKIMEALDLIEMSSDPDYIMPS